MGMVVADRMTSRRGFPSPSPSGLFPGMGRDAARGEMQNLKKQESPSPCCQPARVTPGRTPEHGHPVL